MDVIPPTVLWKFALIYLDDIVIFLKSLGAHIEHNTHVLSLVWDKGAKNELEKCEFFSNTNSKLGNAIHMETLVTSRYPIDSIFILHPVQIFRNYDGSWPCEMSSDAFGRTFCKLQHHWIEKWEWIVLFTSTNSLKTNTSLSRHYKKSDYPAGVFSSTI